MQLEEFIYYLRKEISAGVYEYYTESGGVVSTTPTVTPIEFAPMGWVDKSLEWKRGFEWWGVFTNMTNPLRFVNDGRIIVRDVYYKEGVQGNCELYIERLVASTQAYELYYRGNLDFSKVDDQANHIGVNIMNVGYLEELKSREDTDYEIDIDSHADYFYIYMNGITLLNNIEWLISPESRINNNGVSSIGMSKYFSESPIGGDSFKSVQEGKSYANSAACYTDWNASHINNQEQSMDITVTWDFDFTLYDLPNLNYAISQFSIVLVHTNSAGTVQGTYLAYPATFFYTINNVLQTASGTTTFTLATGDRLHLVANITGSYAYSIVYADNGEYTIESDFRLPATNIKAMYPEDVFEEIIGEIDSNVSVDVAPLVTNRQMAVTSGDALRGLTGAKIKTSFKDFFKTYDNILNLATYYNRTTETHFIVDKADVLDDSALIYDIGEVSNLSVKPLYELLFANLKVGNKDYNYDGLNGRDEFNCEFQFTTPITKVNTTKDMLTKYRTDMYGVEFIRANLSKKTTTDASADNDNFILYTEPTPFDTYLGVDRYALERNGAYIISGLISGDTAFNIDLSPKRNLLRNGSLFRSILHLLDSEYIFFQTASKNEDLSTFDGATTITEKAAQAISGLDTALFYPLVFEFNCANPINVQSLIDTNPYGKITFDWKGNTYEGFLYESSENPATKASQTIKLIATTNNTLTDLIT